MNYKADHSYSSVLRTAARIIFLEFKLLAARPRNDHEKENLEDKLD